MQLATDVFDVSTRHPEMTLGVGTSFFVSASSGPESVSGGERPWLFMVFAEIDPLPLDVRGP